VTDNVYCLVKIIEKDERIIAAVQFEIKPFDFFYQSKQPTDHIYTDTYCNLSKCIGQTPCLYEHFLFSDKYHHHPITVIYSAPFTVNIKDNSALQCLSMHVQKLRIKNEVKRHYLHEICTACTTFLRVIL